jgi:hypothetical protein
MNPYEKTIFVAAAIGIILIPLAIPALIFFVVVVARRLRRKPVVEVKREEPLPPPKEILEIKSAYSPGNLVRLKDGRGGTVKKSYHLWHDVMVDGKEEFLHEEDIKNLL